MAKHATLIPVVVAMGHDSYARSIVTQDSNGSIFLLLLQLLLPQSPPSILLCRWCISWCWCVGVGVGCGLLHLKSLQAMFNPVFWCFVVNCFAWIAVLHDRCFVFLKFGIAFSYICRSSQSVA